MEFLKNILSSCLGVFLAFIVLLLVGGGIIGAVAGSMEKKSVSIKPNSVLKLDFKEIIPEQTDNISDNSISLKDDKKLGLQRIVELLNTAKSDDDIKGIFIDISGISMGRSTATTLRKALEDFKTSGKFIVAYSESYTQSAYYLSSVADHVALHPMGVFDFRGFAAQIPYFKDMLERLGIKMQIYYAGQFKSATEPFRLDKMSDANRTQTKEYLEDIYQQFLEDISKSRNIPIATLREYANSLQFKDAQDVKNAKIVDQVAYFDEVQSVLRKKLGIEDKEKIKEVKLSDYATAHEKTSDFGVKDKIAVIYAEGDIIDGKGDAGIIGGDKYVDIIQEIRKDDKVKAIVMRVNSPGGSALASENIWRELTLAKQQGIPVVVSMGDYAASGGYYISCAADSIFTQANTLTGSIGVFGMIPNIRKTLKDKVGIAFDTVKTGKYAASFNLIQEFNEGEGAYMQTMIDNIYERFLKRVSDGRKKTREATHEIAQGRVWTGRKAIEIGLCDKIGNLNDAIHSAASLAKIEKYRLSEYPRTKDKWQKLMDKLSGEEEVSIDKVLIKAQLGELYPYYSMLSQVKGTKSPQARLPFVLMEY